MKNLYTLYELIQHCKKAIPIYEELYEDSGTSGEMELALYYDEEKEKLIKVLNCMQEELETNKLLPISSFITWLNQNENQEIRDSIFEALNIIKVRKTSILQIINEEIEFSNTFLKFR